MKNCEKCSAVMRDDQPICTMCGWKPLSPVERIARIVPLDDELWAQLESAYGDSMPVLQVIRKLDSIDPANEDELQSAFYAIDFWGYLDHQNSVFECSFAAIPHLVRIAAKLPPTSETRHDLLALMGYISADSDTSIADRDKTDWRAAFMPACIEALADALPLIYASLATGLDEETVTHLLAGTAAICGFSGLAHNITWSADSEATCPKCGAMIGPPRDYF